MSLKMKQIIKNLIKISTLSLVFILAFFIINTFATVENIQEVKTIPNNSTYYKKITIKPIANVAVAITSNIWLWVNKSENISELNINKNIFPVSDFYTKSSKIKEELLELNMIFTKEYYNIIKIDFNWVLKKSDDRSKTLDNIIKQLEIRYSNANTNIITLSKQREILITEYNSISIQLETIKSKMESNFESWNIDLLTNSTNEYYDFKNNQNILNTNIVFIQEFLKKYSYLNNYNKLLLDTLINNKDIISKESYIVIPDSGDQLLREFDLIFTEQEYKQK